ncbi:hypothetical protein BK658_19740 [Pseudomonas brassicacearum]|uniref:Uncharacterized protein n=1 Tax=Pseudomonas brassicacearum TaxID=930166 RepID=A0A423GNG3_9PSED|nr:hypothetical protein BK658_19740 [Pseudomonas brassicacearum]
MIEVIHGPSSILHLERSNNSQNPPSAIFENLVSARQGCQTKDGRVQEYTVSNGFVAGRTPGGSRFYHSVARPYSSERLLANATKGSSAEQISANVKSVAGIAKTMSDLIREGHALAKDNPVSNSPRIALAKHLEPCLREAAKGRLAVLTSPIRLTVGKDSGVSHSPATANIADWLQHHDRSDCYIVLNGNNDETYVSFIGEMLADSKHINFITSGFGGHGTTDRHTIATNLTEGDRFKALLMEKGISDQRITVDAYSTNSGQNAINVANIINRDIQDGKPLGTVIVSGTPAAIFRQTYTYAQQLKVNSEASFQIKSFPFCDEAKYTTLADNLAIIREFSTTLNYLFNTEYLPGDAGVYPEAFFSSAQECLTTFADKYPKNVSGNEEVVSSIWKIDSNMIERFRSGQLTSEDKADVRKVDDFFRSLFNPLELTFKRGMV